MVQQTPPSPGERPSVGAGPPALYILRDHQEFMKSADHLGYGEDGRRRAYEEVRHIAPDAELLSDEGSGAVVFVDSFIAYKVSRGGRYDYTEHESSMVQLLGDAGFAPRFLALHEPPASKRFADGGLKMPAHENNFSRILNPQLTVPILEMEWLDTPPDTPFRFNVLTTQEVREQFKELAGFAIENRIDLGGDTELTVDMKDRRLKFVDLGGVRQDATLDVEEYIAGALWQLAPEQNAEGRVEYPIIQRPALVEIRRRYDQGGLEAVAELITVGSQEAWPQRIKTVLGRIATWPRLPGEHA